MAKRKKYSFTDLNFTKEDLARNSQQVIAKVGYHLLLRVKKRTAINAVWGIKILAKGQKVRSIKKVIGFKTRSALKGLKTVGRRAKTGITKRTRNKIHRKSNGRTIQKSLKRRRNPAWQVKGSVAAKRHMAKVRAGR